MEVDFEHPSHLIDLALALFGLPDEVTADIALQKENALTDDYFHVIFKYGKMRVILHSSSFSNVSPRFQIFGEKGNFVKYGVDPQENQLRSGLSPLDLNFGVENESAFGNLTFPETQNSHPLKSEKGAYLEFYANLYQALTTEGTRPAVSALEALNTIRLIEIAEQSSRAGRTIDTRKLATSSYSL